MEKTDKTMLEWAPTKRLYYKSQWLSRGRVETKFLKRQAGGQGKNGIKVLPKLGLRRVGGFSSAPEILQF
eukprot:6465998-Amphidinium_carterae.1